MKVLVSRPDKIGDVVLALHGVKQLKKLLPELEVYMHVAAYTQPLVDNIKFLDGVILLEEDLGKYQFDAVVDLMAKIESAKRYIKPSIKIKIGNSARWFSPIYNRTKYIRRSYALLHEAEYNWQLLRLLDSRLKNKALVESLDLADFKSFQDFSELDDYYLLMPGISASAVAWPEQNWLELAKRLARDKNRQVLIMVGPAEKPLSQSYQQAFKDMDNIFVKTFSDLNLVLGVLKNCRAFVGPSTGITHLASAVGAKGVALYPEVQSMHPKRWMPFKSSLKVLNMQSGVTVEQLANALENDQLEPGFEVDRTKVSAFIICLNEEKNIGRALESISWCDEIVVVDSGSTDKTLEICESYGAKIFQREWPGHSAQKQFALEQCKHDWVLNIDADEEVSPELRSEIIEILRKPESEAKRTQGYMLSRVVHFLDRWWDKGGWYPEYRMRFFQRSYTSWGGVDPHEKALVRGVTRKLRGDLYHYTYWNIENQINTLNKHSSLSAKFLHQGGRKVRVFNIMLNPLFRFFKFYILKLGFREGLPGFIMAVNEAFSTFLKYTKIWELQHLKERCSESSKECEEEAIEFKKVVN